MDELDYEQIVALHYEDLYRFAYSLAGTADQAGELTQEAYGCLLARGDQIRDRSKVKSWLFTALYRLYLGLRRREERFPEIPLDSAEAELPFIPPKIMDEVDGETVMAALQEIEEHYRAPLALFYLQDFSYREIAEMIQVPVGTVMSRLSRGKDLLRHRLLRQKTGDQPSVIPLDRIRERGGM